MDNFWENEDQEVFRDIPDEVQLDNNGNQLIAPPVNVRTPQRSIAQSVPIQQPIAELQHENIKKNIKKKMKILVSC